MTFSKTDGDHAAEVQSVEDGWVTAMGVRFVRATSEEVVAELAVGPQHLQPLGIVHGGVYAGLIETVTSIGAALNAAKHDLLAVGMENHSSFLHAVRAGTLTATAKPLSTGRRTQLWEATIRDDTGRIAATGRVRLFLVSPGSKLAGEGAELKR